MLPSVDEPVRTAATAPADRAVVAATADPVAIADATAASAFLVATRGVPADGVALLAPATGDALVAAVTAAGRDAGPGGTVWLWFAGVGETSPARGTELVPGASLAALEGLAVAGGAAAVVVLDASFPGSLATVRGAPGVVEWRCERVPLPAAGHGAFTYAALGALRGWADGQRTGVPDGRVTVDEADLYVRDALLALRVAERPSVAGDRTRTLSTATEPRPELDPTAGDAPGPTTVVRVPLRATVTGEPGRLALTSLIPIALRIDLAPAGSTTDGKLVLTGLAPGPHFLEAVTVDGKPLTALAVDLPAGGEVRLLYRDRQLSVVP